MKLNNNRCIYCPIVTYVCVGNLTLKVLSQPPSRDHPPPSQPPSCEPWNHNHIPSIAPKPFPCWYVGYSGQLGKGRSRNDMETLPVLSQ